MRRIGLEPTVIVLAGTGGLGRQPQGLRSRSCSTTCRARGSRQAAQNALVQYVADGGSLAMVGGDQSFGLGG